ncbi:MAG: DEAD/DEAH box helicase [Burkholderiales bacterium]|nr:DEAD/DEAH box helicase [Burkholderiales bacterium]
MTNFETLGLSKDVLSAVKEAGFRSPTSIQEAAIPAILAGKDVLAIAETGSGKTAAFALPLLADIEISPTKYKVTCSRYLVLAPTRELCLQVNAAVDSLGKGLNVKTAAVFGGASTKKQIEEISNGIDFLVATPGRLIDLITQKACSLSEVKCVVIDEADRLLDMGFIPQLNRILKELPRDRQTLMFSATFSDPVKKLASEFLKNPEVIEISANQSAASVEEKIYRVPKSKKHEAVRDLIVDNQWPQVLIFTRTKDAAEKILKELLLDGFKAKSLHGDKTQAARTSALQEFRNGRLPILVATDVAARGLDIEDLPHVINYELPENPEDYVHRVGRTGRAGKKGTAVSLVSSEDLSRLAAIGRFLQRRLEAKPFPGMPISGVAPASESTEETKKSRTNSNKTIRKTRQQSAEPYKSSKNKRKS